MHAASDAGGIILPIERSLYGFLYADASSGWGHRHLVLLQDEPLDGGSGGFANDTGAPDSEGHLGMGTAGADDGSYGVLEDTGTFPVQRDVVMLMIDPVPDDACAYEVAGASDGPEGG